MTTPSKEELQNLNVWVKEHGRELPPSVLATLTALLNIVVLLLDSQRRAKSTLARLREAMGIAPKSERGKSNKPSPAPQESMDLELSGEEEV